VGSFYGPGLVPSNFGLRAWMCWEAHSGRRYTAAVAVMETDELYHLSSCVNRSIVRPR